MSRPVRSLPVVQNWDCNGCSYCCREYRVFVTDAEKERIEALGVAGVPGRPLFERDTEGGVARWRLAHGPDGACVFLSEAGRCRIHEAHGAAAKPLTCQVYPFVLVPCGDHYRVGLRYACPTAAADEGRPLTSHESELAGYARALEARAGKESAAPPLQVGQESSWPDLAVFTKGLLGLMRHKEERLERRLRKCLALADLCRQARFDKVSGQRLAEFLKLVGPALEREVPADPEGVPPPGWVGRLLFRQTLALYARKDQGPDRGTATRTFLGRTWSVWRFARGTGTVPRLHAALPAVTFEQVEAAAGRPGLAADAVLERYYLVKLESMQFAGAPNFGLPFWDGVESLVMTFPMISWLARALHHLPPEDAVRAALRVVDDAFGFNPLLGTGRQRSALRRLSASGELARLVAWYAR